MRFKTLLLLCLTCSLLVILLGPALVSRAAQPATSVTLTPSKDNTLYEDEEGDLSNGAGDHLFAGKTNNGATRRGVLAFDLAEIPAGSTILSATLTLNMSRSVAGPQDVAIHKVLSDWGEGASDASGQEGRGTTAATGDATWLHTFFDTTLWTTPGGDFAPTASATATVSDDVQNYAWGSTDAMVADVQSWLDAPASNFGWIIVGNEAANATAKRFDSRENGDNQPALLVEFASSEPITSEVYLPLLQRD